MTEEEPTSVERTNNYSFPHQIGTWLVRRRVAQVDGSIMAGIVLGMSNKRSIIGVLSLRKTTLYAMRSEIIVELRVLGPAKFFSLGFTWKEPLKRFRGGAIKNHCSSRWMVRIPRFAPAFERPPNSYDGMRTIMLVHLSSPSSFPSTAFLTSAGESWSRSPLRRSTRLF